RQDLAFVASLIFMIHPVHTEVVANVFGRHDILALLFGALALSAGLQYAADPRLRYLLVGSISFFLALMSKEHAAMVLALLPAAIHLRGVAARDERTPEWLQPVTWIGFLVLAAAMYIGDAKEFSYIVILVLASAGVALLAFAMEKAGRTPLRFMSAI